MSIVKTRVVISEKPFRFEFEVYSNKEKRITVAKCVRACSLSSRHNQMKKAIRYKGIARCNPEDRWDEEIGIKIAVYRSMMYFVSVLEKQQEQISTSISALIGKVDKVCCIGDN